MTFPDFLDLLRTVCAEKQFVRLVFTDPVAAKSADQEEKQPQKATARPVQIRGELQFQWSLRIGKQEVHENQSVAELLQRVQDWAGARFRQVRLETTQTVCEGRMNGPNQEFRGREVKRPQAAPDVRHNVAKNYLIPEGTPCGFLEQLGIMTATGQVRAAMQHKFRQINRFLEFVEEIYPEFPAEGPLRVIDFGCGKSYLTFALHHLFAVKHSRAVSIIGLDQNADLIAKCSSIAKKLSAEGLTFRVCDVVDPFRADEGPLDLAVSLHACDIATDAALSWAVSRKARVILSAPCCQHELAPQITSDHLAPILKHGILRQRFAAMATDALRAEALEAVGYRTTIMEFVDLEHSAKNLLLRAIRRPDAELSTEPDWQEYQRVQEFLGIKKFSGDSIR